MHHCTPSLVTTREELASLLNETSRPRVLVPTMGALHRGHAALLETGRQLAGDGGTLVASIFVNPTQFGPGEDLRRLPRAASRPIWKLALLPASTSFSARPGRRSTRPGFRLPASPRPRFPRASVALPARDTSTGSARLSLSSSTSSPPTPPFSVKKTTSSSLCSAAWLPTSTFRSR